jgi:hypothetical protein
MERSVPKHMSNHATNLILLMAKNLFLVPKIEQSARATGHRLEVIEKVDGIDTRVSKQPNRFLTEPLHGPEGLFMRRIVEIQPALILVDLDAEDLPWDRWIQVLKTSAATRRIPILAYGPHVDREKQELALAMGADRFLSRAKLHTSLSSLIGHYTRMKDPNYILSACEDPFSSSAEQGLELLNQGKYYAAHEALEQAWIEGPGPRRKLYRALLQLSVAYYHLQRGNLAGARKLLLRMQQWLHPLPAVCCRIQVTELLLRVKALSHILEEADLEDGEQPPEIWFSKIPRIPSE